MVRSSLRTTKFPMRSFVGFSLVESTNPVEVALNITINPTPKPLRRLGFLRAARSGAGYRGRSALR